MGWCARRAFDRYGWRAWGGSHYAAQTLPADNLQRHLRSNAPRPRDHACDQPVEALPCAASSDIIVGFIYSIKLHRWGSLYFVIF
ncbi:unnamed protein product [Pieris brassicae]|uniref:Uncharacterized protein n=1 Tax=Pieris brassicae TaxID=7116 RepID=A0A9P0TVE1_PIEBR|nr:unnamed protein product [Pieris brassicae]